MERLKETIDKMRPWILVVLIGITFYEVLEHLVPVWKAVSTIASVFMPFVIGAALAWLLDIPVRRLESTKVMKRGLAITIVLVGVILFFVLLVEMVVPQLTLSAKSFMENAPDYIQNLSRRYR